MNADWPRHATEKTLCKARAQDAPPWFGKMHATAGRPIKLLTSVTAPSTNTAKTHQKLGAAVTLMNAAYTKSLE